VPVPRKRIAFSKLVDWVEGRLPEREARAVEEQMAVADGATLADVAWLRKFLNTTKDSVLEAPPPEVRSTLIARYKAHAEGRSAPGLLKRVVARLTFDGGSQPAVGVRSAGTQGARRQLVYSADTLDLALNILPRARDKKFDLHGQVLTHNDVELGSFSVQLLQSETELAITATDDLGSFTMEAIQPGVHELILSSDRIEVSITPVDLNV
jgi:hypothetical protein